MSPKSPLRAVYDAPENRAIDRSYAELEGTCTFNGQEPIACTVSDISPTGAQVTYPGAASAPHIVHLTIPELAMTYEAEVRWQADDRIGLRFISAEKLPE